MINEKKIIIPNYILDLEMNSKEKIIILMIYVNGGKALTKKFLMPLCGMSDVSFRNAMTKLIGKGIVRKYKRNEDTIGQTILYDLNMDRLMELKNSIN